METEYPVKKEYFETVNGRGQTIRGVLFRPDEEGGKYPTVIFSHGFGACYEMFLHHAQWFPESGIAIVFFDFCGGGVNSASDGTMQEMTVLTEADDLDAVIDKVKTMPFVDTDNLFLQGESQGGFVSTIIGVRRRNEIKGLALWYPAYVIPDDSRKRLEEGIKDVFGMELSPQYDTDAISIDVEKLQKNYTGPVIIIHGDADPVVPIDYSRRAVKNFPDAELIEIKDAQHGFNETDGMNARNSSIEFILRNVTELK
ncbi:MAG: lysophospholipase [Lachnospiraceae bacterium]|nr:lysophospholipase [Lachnospiraceae bacterium]